MYAEESYLEIGGVNNFINNFATSTGYGGGICSVRTNLIFKGLHNFTNNSAMYGGGLAIKCHDGHSESLYITPNTSAIFLDNYAQDFGGGIFVMDGLDNFMHCRRELDILQITCFDTPKFTPTPLPLMRLPDHFYTAYTCMCECIGSITFMHNFAESGGNAIHGGALQNCRVEISPDHPYKFDECANQTCYMSGLEAVAALSQTSV